MHLNTVPSTPKASECSICLEDMNPSEDTPLYKPRRPGFRESNPQPPYVSCPNHHVFHKTCMDTHYQHHQGHCTCPLCRVSLEPPRRVPALHAPVNRPLARVRDHANTAQVFTVHPHLQVRAHRVRHAHPALPARQAAAPNPQTRQHFYHHGNRWHHPRRAPGPSLALRIARTFRQMMVVLNHAWNRLRNRN
jgi:hypothetical protein